ncbi:MAG: peptidylprolyl isomerase [Spirochaetia bacterium]|nr:peptidylprolyl isomerase [Spirochaetia bacterium]
MKKTNSIKKIFINVSIVVSVLVLSQACSEKLENQKLAVDKNGPILRKEMRFEAVSRNADKHAGKNINIQKTLVRDYAIVRELVKRAKEENIDKSKEYVESLDLMKEQILQYQYKKTFADDQKTNPEAFYRARHILLKNNDTGVGASAKTQPKIRDEANYKKIAQIREELLSGKIDFESAAKVNSQDGSASKGGDLGYFAKGFMVPEFQNAVHRLARELKGNLYRLKKSSVVYKEASEKSLEVIKLDEGAIVVSSENTEDNKFIKVEVSPNTFGYVNINELAAIQEKEDKISVPVKSRFGWHLVELTETKKFSYQEYINYLKENEFKTDKKNDERASQKADSIWDRIANVKMEDERKNIFLDKGIDINNIQLSADWQKQEYIVKSNNFEIKTSEFENFIKWIAKRSFADYEEIVKTNQINRYYGFFIDIKLYSIEAEKKKIDQTSEYKDLLEANKSKVLADQYKYQKWLADVRPTDDEVEAEYKKALEELKAQKTQKKGKHNQMPPNIQKDSVYKQLLHMKIRETLTKNEEQLLTEISFKVNDDKFKEGVF